MLEGVGLITTTTTTTTTTTATTTPAAAAAAAATSTTLGLYYTLNQVSPQLPLTEGNQAP